MVEPQIVSVRDFTTSRYGQIADNLDAPLGDVLARAEAAVQSYLGRSLLPTQYTEIGRPSATVIFTKHRPILSVTSLRQRASILSTWSTLDPLYITFEAGPGYINHPYMTEGSFVEVVYNAGFDPLPEDLREAIIMQAVLLSFQDLEVYGSGDAKAPGILYMWDDLYRLLKPYKLNPTVYK